MNSSDNARMYQSTIIGLSTVEKILNNTKQLHAYTENDDVVQQVQQYGRPFHEPLARFTQKVRRFDALAFAQTHDTVARKLKHGGQRLQWTFIVAEEVTKLKATTGYQFRHDYRMYINPTKSYDYY